MQRRRRSSHAASLTTAVSACVFRFLSDLPVLPLICVQRSASSGSPFARGMRDDASQRLEARERWMRDSVDYLQRRRAERTMSAGEVASHRLRAGTSQPAREVASHRPRAGTSQPAGEVDSHRQRSSTSQLKRPKDHQPKIIVRPKRTHTESRDRAKQGSSSCRVNQQGTARTRRRAAEKTAVEPSPLPQSQVLPQSQPDAKVLWANIGSVPPSSGRELTNAKLAFALKNATKFSLADLAIFALDDVRPTDFIKSGGSYFQPAGPAPSSPVRMHRRAAARCRWGATTPREGAKGRGGAEGEAKPTGVGEDEPADSARSAGGGAWLGRWWLLSA